MDKHLDYIPQCGVDTLMDICDKNARRGHSVLFLVRSTSPMTDSEMDLYAKLTVLGASPPKALKDKMRGYSVDDFEDYLPPVNGKPAKGYYTRFLEWAKKVKDDPEAFGFGVVLTSVNDTEDFTRSVARVYTPDGAHTREHRSYLNGFGQATTWDDPDMDPAYLDIPGPYDKE